MSLGMGEFTCPCKGLRTLLPLPFGDGILWTNCSAPGSGKMHSDARLASAKGFRPQAAGRDIVAPHPLLHAPPAVAAKDEQLLM